MNKKQLKKDLEVSLVKTIEDLLISINPDAAKHVNDLVYGASKILAKKFYKSIKHKEEKKEPIAKTPAIKKSPAASAKNTSKPAVVKTKAKK